VVAFSRKDIYDIKQLIEAGTGQRSASNSCPLEHCCCPCLGYSQASQTVSLQQTCSLLFSPCEYLCNSCLFDLML